MYAVLSLVLLGGSPCLPRFQPPPVDSLPPPFAALRIFTHHRSLPSLAGAHKFGIGALRYIPFFVQVVLKSTKSIFVMLGERIFAGKVPPMHKIVSVVLISAGVGIFLLYKKSKPGKPLDPAMFQKGVSC